MLFYEGPIARAYLATLSNLGLRPEKIIELVASKDLVSGKPVGRWLPQSLRISYAATLQRNKIHYWSRQLSKSQSGLVEAIGAAVHERFGFAREVVGEANSLRALSSYSDQVDSLLVDGLGDPQLVSYLQQQPATTLLFTGGGIVPAALLELSHSRMLHIHPGFLPDIRGADCALWSSLLQGRTSASCFYMAPGIDSGDIVLSSWLPRLSVQETVADIDAQSLYRATYAFIDPWIRAFVLRQIVTRFETYGQLNSTPQSQSNGTTFHFMHDRVKRVALQRLYVG